jgi:hypothetical protein
LITVVFSGLCFQIFWNSPFQRICNKPDQWSLDGALEQSAEFMRNMKQAAVHLAPENERGNCAFYEIQNI